MTIKKAHDKSIETLQDTILQDWYIAQEHIKTRHTATLNVLATATGYGTTHYNALISCMRNITKILSL